MPSPYQVRNNGLQRLPGNTPSDVPGQRGQDHDWTHTLIEVGCGFLVFIALKLTFLGLLAVLFLAQGG